MRDVQRGPERIFLPCIRAEPEQHMIAVAILLALVCAVLADHGPNELTLGSAVNLELPEGASLCDQAQGSGWHRQGRLQSPLSLRLRRPHCQPLRQDQRVGLHQRQGQRVGRCRRQDVHQPAVRDRLPLWRRQRRPQGHRVQALRPCPRHWLVALLAQHDHHPGLGAGHHCAEHRQRVVRLDHRRPP
jgi:hypothetical protein